MKILYVEDDARDAELTQRHLRKAAPQCVLETVTTESEAIARLGEPGILRYDVVLTDMHLPDGDGLSLVTFIRKRALPVAVVVITGAGDEEAAVAVLKAGADDYLVKRRNYRTQLLLTLEQALQRFRADSARRARPLKVLYAEYSRRDIDFTRQHLSRYAPHIQLDTVTTGPDALQCLPQDGLDGKYDVILLDSRVPGFDPLEVLKELRQVRGSDIPVLLVIAQGDDEIALQTIKLGASGYVVKHPGYLYQLPGELEGAFYRAELTRGQQVLIRSEARFRTLVEHLPVGVIICGAQGEITLCNHAATELLGLPAAQLLGNTWYNPNWQAFHEDHSPYTEATDPVTQAIARGKPVLNATMGLAVQAKQERLWLLVNAVPWLGPDGKVQQVLCTFSDITERRRAEESLRASEARYRSVVESQTELICRYRPDTRLTFVNDAYCRLFGKTREELLGKQFLEFIPDSAREAALNHVASLTKQPRVVTYEHEVLLPDGSIGWQQWIDHAICDMQGRVIEFQAIGRDITERKRAEEAVRVTQGLLQSTIDALTAHIAILDEQATIIAVNEAWRRHADSHGFHGLGHGIGLNYLTICRAAVGSAGGEGHMVEAGIRAVMSGERDDFRLVYRCPTASEDMWFQIRVTPFGGQGARRLVVAHENVTEIKRAEEALRDLAGQLLTAHEEERRWLARELHDDVSQRLAVLAIGIGTLTPQVPDDLPSLHGRIQTLRDQIATLSADVHRLSRQLHPAILEDLGIVDAIATDCFRFAEREGVSVRFTPQDVPKILSPQVALCLYRITQESLHNIAKHARATEVQVALTGEQDGTRLTIRDNGVGFDPVQELGGLGLASMKERVRLIHGRLAIHTRPGGHGTLIEVWAPAARRET